MPSQKRGKPLYVRGDYQLVQRPGRNIDIVWYDAARGRERSVSARSKDLDEAKTALDRLYLEQTGGELFCPACGQRKQAGGRLVTAVIADYLTLKEEAASIEAIRARLSHVLTYITEKDLLTQVCEAVDEDWAAAFRKWATKVPIVSPTGKVRQRSLSTVENSLLQLRAAIAKCGGIIPRFKAIQSKDVNQTPQHRSDVAEFIAMFRFCIHPEAGKQPVTRVRRDRANLLNFLRISVATMARPDAALDFSTAPARKQWNARMKVMDLNPAGRRQTRKYRAVVRAPRQMVPLLNATDGYFVDVLSVKSAWERMAATLGLPMEGESGTKLVRRSVANIVRGRLAEEAWGELEIALGHKKFDDVSDLYAPFRPDYLRRLLAVIEELIDEIEAAVPGAFVPAGEDSEVGEAPASKPGGAS